LEELEQTKADATDARRAGNPTPFRGRQERAQAPQTLVLAVSPAASSRLQNALPADSSRPTWRDTAEVKGELVRWRADVRTQEASEEAALGVPKTEDHR